ncbi:MAG: cob(I)yrinic acid a,c-diamide adenosyltransferase [Candidatus Hodarchaeota archaeon]
MTNDLGLLQIYTGDGKGKTTAALGLAMRAAGHGLKVYMIQFMKGQINYGELETAKKISNFTIVQFGRPEFVDKEKPAEVDIKLAHDALAHAREILQGGKRYDIIILDELNVALDFKLISLEEVFSLLETRPKDVELIITGRYAHPELVKRADLVSEILNIKHPFTEGVQARKGIEH